MGVINYRDREQNITHKHISFSVLIWGQQVWLQNWWKTVGMEKLISGAGINANSQQILTGYHFKGRGYVVMRPWLSWFCNNSMFCRPVTEDKILTNVTPSLTQPNRSSASVYPLCAVYRPFGHLTAGFFFIAKHPQLFLSLAKSERKYLTSKFLGTNQIPVVRVV